MQTKSLIHVIVSSHGTSRIPHSSLAPMRGSYILDVVCDDESTWISYTAAAILAMNCTPHYSTSKKEGKTYLIYTWIKIRILLFQYLSIKGNINCTQQYESQRNPTYCVVFE